MVHDGVREPGEGLAVPHELTDFQADFLGARRGGSSGRWARPSSEPAAEVGTVSTAALTALS